MTDISTSMFHGSFYIRHNQRRLEHLASLRLDMDKKSVLEPGAGIGDHTLFYLDRGCRVTSIEPRAENVAAFHQNIADSGCLYQSNYNLIHGDFWSIELLEERFDIVHAYGVLYHLDDPARALAVLANKCNSYLLLETCISPAGSSDINPVQEPADNVSQAFNGRGCRPGRDWLVTELNRHFEHVYEPIDLPRHEQFPSEGSAASPADALVRGIYVASREALDSPFLQAPRFTIRP